MIRIARRRVPLGRFCLFVNSSGRRLVWEEVNNQFEAQVAKHLGGDVLNLWKKLKEFNGAKVGLVKGHPIVGNYNQKNYVYDKTQKKYVEVTHTKWLNVVIPIGPVKPTIGPVTFNAGAISIFLGVCKGCK